MPIHKPVTRDSIIEFIRANQYRSNPGSTMPLDPETKTSCEYFDYDDEDYRPSCVIGNVLFEAGYAVEDVYHVGNVRASILFRDLGIRDVNWFAGDIQEHADRGYTWGTALQLALIKRGEA